MPQTAPISPSLETERQAVLAAALPHIPFDGWTEKALTRATKETGFTKGYDKVLFPTGVAGLVECFLQGIDREMQRSLTLLDKQMPIRDRIHYAVMLRLQLMAPYKQAIPKLLTYFALPHHPLQGMRQLWATADGIWRGIGINSSDFSYYTRRGLLAGVYSSTLLYWLSDDSADCANTRAFLTRRIGEVLQVGKWLGSIRSLKS